MKKKFAVTFISLCGLLLSSCSLLNHLVKGSLTSISIETKPTKSIYVEGESFDPTGLVLSGTYSNKKVESIPYYGNENHFTFSISLDTPLMKSDRSLGITYKDKSTTLEIEVEEISTLDKTKLSYTYDDYTENSYMGIDNCPLQGNPKLLIIPIWFNDSDTFIDESKKEDVRNDIKKAYVGDQSDTGWHSVKSYYETESVGKLHLNATVADWYNVNTSYVTYGPEEAVTNTASLVKTASDYYFSNSSDNRKDYDSNNDGYLDGVILVYAAPDYDSLADESYKNLWAYCYWTGNYKNKTSPNANVFFWASYDFLYGSNASEKTGKSSYARGYTENGITIDTHCFIHEMGHVFGLDDYYDYSDFEYNPAGGFSMQDMNVGGHDPYSVMAYGWADPYIPEESITISIGDFQSTHDVILLANHEVSDSPFDEYLLLEYYTPTGLNEFDSKYAYRGNYPKGSSSRGIRLWHVDARLFSGYPVASALTNNPADGYVHHAMSNTYDGNHASMMGKSYYNYNILQLIRNNKTETYKPKADFNTNSLFRVGDSFDMETYSSQFVNSSKMNDKDSLGWSFKIVSINDNDAIISLTKQ